jgi:hypothetical protein
MEQSFENENTCDIFMNEVRIKNEPLQEPKNFACVSNYYWMGTHLGQWELVVLVFIPNNLVEHNLCVEPKKVKLKVI